MHSITYVAYHAGIAQHDSLFYGPPYPLLVTSNMCIELIVDCLYGSRLVVLSSGKQARKKGDWRRGGQGKTRIYFFSDEGSLRPNRQAM